MDKEVEAMKKETKNYVTKYTLRDGTLYHSSIIDPQYQAVLEARFEGIEFTSVEQCYCGNLKSLSGLNCKKCESWGRAHS